MTKSRKKLDPREKIIRTFSQFPAWKKIFAIRKKCKYCGRTFGLADYIRSFPKTSKDIKDVQIIKIRGWFERCHKCSRSRPY